MCLQKCTALNGWASSTWADISGADRCMCRAGVVCLLKSAAPNTVILPLLLTLVCKTMILVKILQGPSHGEQLPFLSLLMIVFHCSTKNSPSLKALATYRKTRISQVGAEWELRCAIKQLAFLQPICSLQICVVNKPQLYWWLRGKSIINATKIMSKYCAREITQFLLHMLSFHWPPSPDHCIYYSCNYLAEDGPLLQAGKHVSILIRSWSWGPNTRIGTD